MKAVNTLDYTIKVLINVSFDVDLFNKELSKAKRKLLPYDLEKLNAWLIDFIESKPELHSNQFDFSI